MVLRRTQPHEYLLHLLRNHPTMIHLKAMLFTEAQLLRATEFEIENTLSIPTFDVHVTRHFAHDLSQICKGVVKSGRSWLQQGVTF